GYELGAVFHEPPPQGGTLPPAFVDLVQECRRAAAHAVITLHGCCASLRVVMMSSSSMVMIESWKRPRPVGERGRDGRGDAFVAGVAG
ncbi:hypothetical protein, partial [Nocardia amamiensis]|uniref:hypothetical protein n=1 Tax=Nocardia amamiensis TaxID=404578 RepID=UPI001E2D533A